MATYRGWKFYWEVYDYDENKGKDVLVKTFDDAEEAAKYCIDHGTGGAVQLLLKRDKSK